MREVLAETVHWWRQGSPVALATVVGTWKSSPRQPGASMLLGGDGAVVGSVSGGCVEGAVYELAQQVVADGVPVLQRYGVSDDDAFAVGLTCGGILDVFVERLDERSFPELGDVAEAISAGRPVAVATTTVHPDPARVGQRLVLFGVGSQGDTTSGTLGSPRADAAVIDDARGLLAAGRNGTLRYGPDGERLGDGMEVFVASYAPPARMLVFGAIDFAAAANASRTPTRWWCAGRTSTCWPSGTPGVWTSAPCCACSPTTPSSTSRCWSWHSATTAGRSDRRMWGRWAVGAPTTTASSGYVSGG